MFLKSELSSRNELLSGIHLFRFDRQSNKVIYALIQSEIWPHTALQLVEDISLFEDTWVICTYPTHRPQFGSVHSLMSEQPTLATKFW